MKNPVGRGDASWHEVDAKASGAQKSIMGKLHQEPSTSFSEHPGHGDGHRTAREHPMGGGTKLSEGQIPNPSKDPIRVMR